MVWSSFYTTSRNKALAAEANEGESWWSAEESRLIKMPTARIPIFDCWRTIVFGRKEKRAKNALRFKMRTSKASG